MSGSPVSIIDATNTKGKHNQAKVTDNGELVVVTSQGGNQIGSRQLTNDAIPTSDVATEALTFQMAFNGATWDRVRTPNTFKSLAATAAGNTALWTPAAGKKFRLMRFMVSISGASTLAVAGNEVITFQDATTAIGGVLFQIQVPAAAVTGEDFTTGWIDWGNGFLSAAINQTLNVNLGTAFTAGGAVVICAGTEE